MKSFKTHRGKLAALNRANIDTDQIIPKQFLKSIKRTGFGPSLFFDWRYLADGKPNPQFELNKPDFSGASILVTGANFGCGSSREHAVWALQQYGFEAIIAPSYSDIFHNNGIKNGLLIIALPTAEIEEIFQMVQRYRGLEATVDLEHQCVTLHLPEEMSFHFDIEPAVKEHLIAGMDEIGRTFTYEKEITLFEADHNVQMML